MSGLAKAIAAKVASAMDDEGRAKQRADHRASLVDDPFSPGQLVSPAMAKLHPHERASAAVDARFASMRTPANEPEPSDADRDGLAAWDSAMGRWTAAD